jgi:hypothetical protein
LLLIQYIELFLTGFILGGSDRQTWIDVCQKAIVDPRAIVDKHLDRLLKLVLDASVAKSQVPFISSSTYSPMTRNQAGFEDASYSAITTLSFISPTSVLPQIIQRLQEDLDPEVLNALSDEELSIWAMPEGTTFVDGPFFVCQVAQTRIDSIP